MPARLFSECQKRVLPPLSMAWLLRLGFDGASLSEKNPICLLSYSVSSHSYRFESTGFYYSRNSSESLRCLVDYDVMIYRIIFMLV